MAFDPWSLGAGILGGAANMFGQNAANKAIEEQIRAALNAYRKQRGKAAVAGGLALQERQRGLADILGGFEGALAATERGGRSAEIGAMDEAQQALGGAGQDLISAGMYDPQALTWARRGVSSDLMRAIGVIRENTAARRAGLLTTKGLATAGARGDIASQIMQNYGLDADITDKMAGLRTSYQPASTNQAGNIGSLFGWLKQAFGTGAGPSFDDRDMRVSTDTALSDWSKKWDPFNTEGFIGGGI